MKGILTVIPARSGSKGVPDKNIAVVAGESLLARAARCVVAAGFGDTAIVSTDSARYAAQARSAGVDAPFLRPSHLSADDTSAWAVLEHARQFHESATGDPVEAVLWVEPTSPLRRPDDLCRAVEMLRTTDAETVVAVSPVPTAFHPDKVLVYERWLAHGSVRGRSIANRQNLEGAYFARNGVCYVVGRTALDHGKGFVTERSLPLVIERPVANIDTPLDLAWAEFLLQAEEPW